MNRRSDIYGGKDPRDVAIYTVPHAATLVRVPTSTLRAWVFGRRYPVSTGTKNARPVIRATEPGYLSFTNLVEAHVLAAMRREHGVTLPSIRRAVDFVEKQLGFEHPLARRKFKTDGVSLFVDHLGSLINASRSGQLALREALGMRLDRVDYQQGRALRLFPLQRPDQPKVIVIDPRRAFGEPVIEGYGIPAAAIRDRFLAGDSVRHLAREFGIRGDLIEEAVRAA